jgi:hypothetical protein
MTRNEPFDLVGVAGFEPAASSSRTTPTDGTDQDSPASPQDRSSL